MSTVGLICASVALFLSGAAAVFDHRRRVIPDWLTLPVLLGAPLALGLALGFGGLVRSVLGAAACTIAPLLLARRGAMGGGDVKLFAALGALLGYTVGVEAQLFAFATVLVFAVGRSARNKQLGTLLRGSADAFQRSFKRGEAGRVDRESMQAMPLAPAIAAGVVIALALEMLA